MKGSAAKMALMKRFHEPQSHSAMAVKFSKFQVWMDEVNQQVNLDDASERYPTSVRCSRVPRGGVLVIEAQGQPVGTGERSAQVAVLKARVPELGTNEEINGANAVDALVELYSDLNDTGRFFQIEVKRG